jgi:hypothetical protein
VIVSCTDLIDCNSFTFERKSTGEKFRLYLDENAVPDDFLKVQSKLSMQETITQKEQESFKKAWEEFRDFTLTKSNYELFNFEKTKKKETTSSIQNLLLLFNLIILSYLGLILFRKWSIEPVE